MANIQKLAKRCGRNHELALALWETGWYEARMLAAFVDEPARVTPAQMDRWCRDFDNWAIVDTRLLQAVRPHAARVGARSRRGRRKREEFEKRAGVRAAGVPRAARQGRAATRRSSTACRSSSAAATDERNFVKKGVSWALRGIGTPQRRRCARGDRRWRAGSPRPTTRPRAGSARTRCAISEKIRPS